MRKIGMLFVCVLLAACGGSKSSGSQEPAQTAQAEPIPAAAEPATGDEQKPGEQPVLTGQTAAATPPPAPEPPKPTTATAELKSVKDGTSMGTITFERGEEGKISMNGTFSGLKKKGVHAFYIHEKGDCSNKAKNVGKHLNPTKAKHGPPASSTRHAGDFGNLTADASGAATFAMETDSVTMEPDRPDSILNRAVVIHAKKDDKKGSGGPAIACGVIQLSQ